VILSTQDPDQAFLCADRVAVLHRGALLAAGRPADVITPAMLRDVYRVDVAVHEVERGPGGRTCVCVASLARRATTDASRR
jgi:iron complex transport system ATP-binding protein